jgi:hypothetical protein
MKIVEHINIILEQYDRPAHQSQNHSCIWRWKWFFIFMLKCLTDKQLCEALFEYTYLLIIIIYFSYNTGWDENHVLFTRLILILFHETSLFQRESPPPIITFDKKKLRVYNYWITTVVSFPFISSPVVVAVVSLWLMLCRTCHHLRWFNKYASVLFVLC